MIRLHHGSLETFPFPGGEVHVRIGMEYSSPVTAYLDSSQEIMRLLLLADAMRRNKTPIRYLTILYFPYARQDRVCNPGEALSVKVMADLINSMNIEEVVIHDPHSDIVGALVNNCRIIEQYTLVPPIILNDKIIICPDAGAEKKIHKLKRPYIMATKVRDTNTGAILETKIYDADKVRNKACIIIDDICDGGKTFIELAKALKQHDAKSVELYVTHGVFSKGIEVFNDLIDVIYYYDKNGEFKTHVGN